MLTITAAVLSAVLLTAAVLLARDQGAPAGPVVPAVVAAANHAVRIDPSTYQPVAAVAVGTDPAATAAGGGLFWFANRQDGTVTEVDPATNQLQQTIPASGSWPAGQSGPGLAFASGSIWVANVNQRQVTRVPPDADPSTIAVDANPNVIAAAQDAVWVAGRTDSGGGLVARINAGTNQVGQTARLPYAPTGLATTRDGQTVWVATAGDRTLRRVDTRVGGKDWRIELPHSPGQFGDGAVWVTSSEDDAVMRINASSHAIQTIPVGNGPSGIAFGADRVWVTNGQDGTISVIDPETNEVGTRQLGFRPAAVAVDQRAVWVALAA